MHQHRFFKPFSKLTTTTFLSLLGWLGTSPLAFGQTTAPAAVAESVQAAVPIVNSTMDAETFYKILMGELNLLDNEPRVGFALILDSARKTKDTALFDRAVTIALQSRSGESALTAARAWALALPEDLDAARYVLQLLIALNKPEQTQAAALAYTDLFKTKADIDRKQALTTVADIFLNAQDKAAAALNFEAVVKSGDFLTSPVTTSTAWVALGRVRLAANDLSAALQAAKQAQLAQPSAAEPVMLGIALLVAKEPLAEPFVKQYLANTTFVPKPEVRLAYSRFLVAGNRFDEALVQTQKLSVESPTYAPAWLVLGTLQYQASLEIVNKSDTKSDDKNNATVIASAAAAQTSLTKFIQLTDGLPVEQRSASQARAYILLANMAKGNKQYQQAYDTLAKAIANSKEADQADLQYDLAMMAEKLERMDEMERILRQVIDSKPEDPQAYNALGYSLADRSLRLPEAKELIQKAVKLAPEDPFIADSLGWVEFKLGNLAEAQRILEAAYKTRPDAEIAAHLGEVLWQQGLKDRATAMWKEGLKINKNNETLVETLKRFGLNLSNKP
jgi:tetratricopeptide (TPR) repeat protein